MRRVLLGCVLLVGACGSSSIRKERLRVEPVTMDGTAVPMADLGDDMLVGDFKAQTMARVSPGSGEKWRRPFPAGVLVQNATPPTELWFIGTDMGTFKSGLERVDIATGMSLGTVKIDYPLGTWVQSGGGLFNVDSYELKRIDPATGTEVWSVKGSFNEYNVEAGARVIWVGCKGGICGHALDTGALVATLPHANWPMLTPDGKDLVLQAPASADAYDAATGTKRWSASVPAGEVVNKTAVTDRWLAVLSDQKDGKVDHIRVFPRGGGDAVWSVASKSGTYLEYMAASGDLVVWYESASSAIYAARMPDGARVKVYQLHETFVLSTDASGMAPAVPDHDPEIDGDVVTVSDFGNLHAFRVR